MNHINHVSMHKWGYLVHVSVFLCIFSTFIYIYLHFIAFDCISLHFTFYILGKFDRVYRRPMDAIFTQKWNQSCILVVSIFSLNYWSMLSRFYSRRSGYVWKYLNHTCCIELMTQIVNILWIMKHIRFDWCDFPSSSCVPFHCFLFWTFISYCDSTHRSKLDTSYRMCVLICYCFHTSV